jgi:hypothetical protein
MLTDYTLHREISRHPPCWCLSEVFSASMHRFMPPLPEPV